MTSLHICETIDEKVSGNHLIAEKRNGAGSAAILPVLRHQLWSLKYKRACGVNIDPALINDIEIRIRALESGGTR